MHYSGGQEFIPSEIPHMDNFSGYFKKLKVTELTPKTKNLLHQVKPVEIQEDKTYDLVYIVKPGDDNPDLRFSLRSVYKFCTFKNIWIIGYKPDWVKNVKYIHTEQTADKWKNSILNYLTACNTPDISENFILMNDDFFALHYIRDWKKETNKCLGTITEKLAKLGDKKQLSRWQTAFVTGRELLTKLNCKTEYNYEAHLPLIINKTNFLKMFEIPEIKAFNETNKVLHKRSIYKNLYPEVNPPIETTDVKLELQEDLTDERLDANWISVYDYMVNNCRVYPKLNKMLFTLFEDKCEYEI